MTPLLSRLLARAFESSPADQANEAIARVRAARLAAYGEAHSYEVAVPALGPDEYLTTKVLPKLAYYLDCRRGSLTGTPHVFVSLFVPGRLAFLESADVVSLLAEARGLSLEEVKRRYGEQGTGDPRLLGG